ncbi:MAG: DNA recombination protein RmuC, partial [Polyangiaceae bacterium]|nr:DNA recombination protein RmuC [Polyangiaceae bacterium]
MPLVAWLLGIAVIVVGVVVALALGRLRPARATDREAAAAQKLSQCEAELAALRTATVESDRGLAVAEEKARRVPELEASLRDARDQVERTREEKAELKAQLATLQESLAQERARSEEKLALLSDTKARLAEQFKVVAEEVMGQHGETFKKQNKEQIDGLLTPLREQLTAFQTGLQTAHLDSAKDRERLAEQIRSFVTTGAIMTSETKSLTRALRGETQTQGAWGEMILETI